MTSSPRKNIELVKWDSNERSYSFNAVEAVFNIMEKSGMKTNFEVKKIMSKSEIKAERDLTSNIGWEHIFENALKMFTVDFSGYSIEELISSCSTNTRQVSLLFMLRLLNDWCEEQNINIDDFVCCVQTVLHLADPKLRILYMECGDYSGVDFWIDTMLPDEEYVGYVKMEFPYGECIEKRIITVEESSLNENVMDEILRVCGSSGPVKVAVNECEKD